MADKNSPVKAVLKVQLLANDLLIAESDDKALWQEVLAAIQSSDSDSTTVGKLVGTEKSSAPRKDPPKPRGGVDGFAADLGLPVDIVQGACSPSAEPPFLHLDEHCWESLKRNTPQRGAKAIAAINLSATLLCLWFKHLEDQGNPTPTQAKDVLRTIGLSENNPSRAVKNCEWLQSRAGGIQLNPARVSRAKSIARAYCAQTSIEDS